MINMLHIVYNLKWTKWIIIGNKILQKVGNKVLQKVMDNIKVKLSRCLTKYHAMKTLLCLIKHQATEVYEGMET